MKKRNELIKHLEPRTNKVGFFEVMEASQPSTNKSFCSDTNPTTGLDMVGGVDISGKAYGER